MLADDSRFNDVLGEIAIRFAAPGENVGRVRMRPGRRHSNLQDVLHGGVTLAFLDVALFAGCRALGVAIGRGAVTVDVSCQFTGAGRLNEELIAEVECVRETGKLVFLRGRMVQGAGSEHVVAAFSGLLRKGRAPETTG